MSTTPKDPAGMLAALGLTPNRDGLIRCPDPDHEDTHPSCSLRVADAVWNCHSCGASGGPEALAAAFTPTDEQAAALMVAHGFPLSQGMYDRVGAEKVKALRDGAEPPIGRVVASYTYQDAVGAAVLRVDRIEPGPNGKSKTFRQYHPQGEQWVRGGTDSPPPYRLPEVAAAAAAGSIVYVVEGEKDADALVAAGYVATTCPMGAGKWPIGWGAAHFAGAQVVVVADKDKPGRTHAAKVMADLDGHATAVQLVEAAHGKDAADHLAAGFGVDAFVPVVEKAAAPTSRLRAYDVSRMLTSEPPPVPWVVEGLVARGVLTLLAGREGIGKSMLTIALAVAVASGGGDVAGLTCHGGRVLIVDAENGEAEVHRRIRSLGLPDEAVARIGIYGCDAGDLLNEGGLGDLADVLGAFGPDLLVLDSFASLWRGDENKAEDVGPHLDALRNLIRSHGAGVLLLHHAGKAMGTEYRGSTAIGAASEIVTRLSRHEDDDDPDRFRLTCSKVRPARRWPPRWMRMHADEAGVFVDAAEPPGGVGGRPPDARDGISADVLAVLRTSDGPMSQSAVIRALGRPARDNTTRRALAALITEGLVTKADDGYRATGAGSAAGSVAAAFPGSVVERG